MAIVAISRGVNGAHLSTTPLFNADAFTPALAAAALSIAVLSFLGFDESRPSARRRKGGRRSAGVAMISGLLHGDL